MDAAPESGTLVSKAAYRAPCFSQSGDDPGDLTRGCRTHLGSTLPVRTHRLTHISSRRVRHASRIRCFLSPRATALLPSPYCHRRASQ
ncbi:hypothetical protein KCP76_18500 [Salmonella enterica subsp. enterica serovar Weltevreden]|nr:hypothetical protein KCP76_18500 [Salmonella enterica subsp. enterica serovar Weltevreden]